MESGSQGIILSRKNHHGGRMCVCHDVNIILNHQSVLSTESVIESGLSSWAFLGEKQ